MPKGTARFHFPRGGAAMVFIWRIHDEVGRKYTPKCLCRYQGLQPEIDSVLACVARESPLESAACSLHSCVTVMLGIGPGEGVVLFAVLAGGWGMLGGDGVEDIGHATVFLDYKPAVTVLPTGSCATATGKNQNDDGGAEWRNPGQAPQADFLSPSPRESDMERRRRGHRLLVKAFSCYVLS